MNFRINASTLSEESGRHIQTFNIIYELNIKLSFSFTLVSIYRWQGQKTKIHGKNIVNDNDGSKPSYIQ